MSTISEPPVLTFAEGMAVALARDPDKLAARIARARNALSPHLRPGFKPGAFEFEKQRLVDSSGRFCLQWKLRRDPTAPISSKNQQTHIGVVEWASVERADAMLAATQSARGGR